MNDVQLVLRAGHVVGMLALGGTLGIITKETVSGFRQRLKDGVPRLRAAKAFLLYVRYQWDWLRLSLAMPTVYLVGFVIGLVLGTFGVGLMEVVPR